ncbi:MAG TPA: serine hydrolase [Steroidobacteraceae bacterium]|nr:serine hydrolase [Steroidobacteraceae bacterium]
MSRWTLVLMLLLAAPVFAAPAAMRDGLEVADPLEVSLHPGPLQALNAAVIAEQFPDTTSVLVHRRGKLVFERYFGAGGINILNDTRSVTKTLTALVVGQAVSEGALRSGDQPAFGLVPQLAPFQHDGALKRGITIMDLLTMSSALDCNDFDERNVGNEENMYPLANWTRWVVDLPVKSGYSRTTSGRGPFSYCTGGTFLLGQIVQRAVGMPLDRYFDQKLFLPLGIRERQWARSPSGEYQSGGGLRLRSRDLLKLGVLLQEDGQWLGHQIVPAAWVRQMQTLSNVVNEQQGYGMLTWQRQYASPCGRINGWYMSGNGGNAVVVVPLKNLVAVVTRTHYNQRGMHDETVRLLEKHVFAALPCS